MHGKTRRQTAYYACQPSHNLGHGAERAFPEHPVSIWVREEFLVEGILGFFSERIFGVNRRELLDADLKRVESEVDRGARRRIKSLEKTIGQLEARQDRLVRKLVARRRRRRRHVPADQGTNRRAGERAAEEAGGPARSARRRV
jgi:site-specific DNA recombinase